MRRLEALLLLCSSVARSALLRVNDRSNEPATLAASMPLRSSWRSASNLANYWEKKRRQLVAITDARDFSYYSVVNVGGQPFNVALDTGSADLWIQTQNCTSNTCVGAPQYIASPSLVSALVPFTINYLSGVVQGVVGTDTVRLLHYEVASQVFALAENVQNVSFAQIGVSGMLGLGFPSIAAIPSSSGLPIIFNIARVLKSTQQFFAFRLCRDDGPNTVNSTFSIGQHDPIVTNQASLQYIPIYPKNLAANTYDFWKVPLDAIIVNGISLPLGKSKVAGSKAPIAVFDTGTSLILGPSKDVDAFYGSMTSGSPSKNPAGQWTVDCLLAINMLVVLGGRPYPIHPLDLAWDKISDGQGRCFGGVQINDGVVSGDFLFGDTAMRNIYTAHYFETASSPPVLGLLSTTTPANSLRDFIALRGPNFLLSSGTSFSDDVLLKTYSSAYPNAQALAAQSLDPDSGTYQNYTNGNGSMPYYVVPGKAQRAFLTREFVFVLLIIAGAGAVGFLAGTIFSICWRRHGRDRSLWELKGHELDDFDAETGPLLADRGERVLRTNKEKEKEQGRRSKLQAPKSRSRLVSRSHLD